MPPLFDHGHQQAAQVVERRDFRGIDLGGWQSQIPIAVDESDRIAIDGQGQHHETARVEQRALPPARQFAAKGGGVRIFDENHLVVRQGRVEYVGLIRIGEG